jgi:hypothetical protein
MQEDPLKKTPAVELIRDALPKPVGGPTDPEVDDGPQADGNVSAVSASGGADYADVSNITPIHIPPRAARDPDRSRDEWMAIFTALAEDPLWSSIDHTRNALWQVQEHLRQGRLGVSDNDGKKAIRDQVLYGMFFACGQMRAAILKFYGKGPDEATLIDPSYAKDAPRDKATS